MAKAKVVVERAQRYMRDHFNRMVTLNELAAQAEMPPHLFLKAYKQVSGKTPKDFMNELRMAEAIRLLQESGQKLWQVARTCGFSSQSWFSTVFRTYAGITPKQYRRLYNMGKAPKLPPFMVIPSENGKKGAAKAGKAAKGRPLPAPPPPEYAAVEHLFATQETQYRKQVDELQKDLSLAREQLKLANDENWALKRVVETLKKGKAKPAKA